MNKSLGWALTLAGGAILIWVGSQVALSRDTLKWPQTQGQVVSSSLVIKYLPASIESKSDLVRWYGVDIQYEYVVDGGEYLSNRVAFRDKLTRNPKPALKVMNKYRHQHEVAVYYNPADPQKSILEPADIGDFSIPLIVGGLLVLLGLLGLYDRSMEINITGVENDLRQGQALQKRGKLDEALIELNKVIERSPGLATGYSNRGIVFLQQKDWDKAIADFNEAISIAPDLGINYFNRANAYLGKKQLDVAWLDMMKAVEMGYKVKPEILESIHQGLYGRPLDKFKTPP